MRAGQARELERLSAESRRSRIARVFAELDKRTKAPDADWPRDLWELQEMREKLCV